MTETALEIYQHELDILSAAITENDAAKFRDHLHFPHRIVTEKSEFLIETEADFARQFNGFIASLAGLGINSYIRIARSASFDDAGRIIGRHSCYLTNNGKLVVPEFEGTLVLEHRNGHWGAIQTLHHMKYVSWPATQPPPGAPT